MANDALSYYRVCVVLNYESVLYIYAVAGMYGEHTHSGISSGGFSQSGCQKMQKVGRIFPNAKALLRYACENR